MRSTSLVLATLALATLLLASCGGGSITSTVDPRDLLLCDRLFRLGTATGGTLLAADDCTLQLTHVYRTRDRYAIGGTIRNPSSRALELQLDDFERPDLPTLWVGTTVVPPHGSTRIAWLGPRPASTPSASSAHDHRSEHTTDLQSMAFLYDIVSGSPGPDCRPMATSSATRALPAHLRGWWRPQRVWKHRDGTQVLECTARWTGLATEVPPTAWLLPGTSAVAVVTPQPQRALQLAYGQDVALVAVLREPDTAP